LLAELKLLLVGFILCDSDTENDDTLTSTRGRRTATKSSTTAAQLDDIIDTDSDFEASSKPRVSTAAAASKDKAKYYALTIMISRNDSVTKQIVIDNHDTK